MANCVLRDSTVLGDFLKPYIVAEVNTSHNGSMETAKEMIDRAKEAGCSCVKFQSWSKESLYSKTYYDENPIAKRIIQKFAFSEAQLMEVLQYSRERGIAFSSTPYSQAEVDFLVDKCHVPYIKVASMDLVNYPFLEYIAGRGVPIVLATGMGEMEEIRRAVATIEAAGNRKICLLHCISIYPPEIATIRLNNIAGLRKEFPAYPVGLSDHSRGDGRRHDRKAFYARPLEDRNGQSDGDGARGDGATGPKLSECPCRAGGYRKDRLPRRAGAAQENAAQRYRRQGPAGRNKADESRSERQEARNRYSSRQDRRIDR